jgi:hypothetical protein
MIRFALLAMLALTGCEQVEHLRHVVDTVEVKVPVLERAEAPPELYREKIPASALPRWVAPSDPAASACLTKESEPLLKSLILRDTALLDGWESYSR